MTVMDEIRGMSDEEWGSLWADLLAEFGRRQTMASAPGEIQRITEGYLDARDGTQPEPTQEALADVSAWPAWVQPTGAHDAYTLGRIVAHGGRLWRSEHAANVWEPGAAGAEMTWEDVTGDTGDLEPEPAPSAPEWKPGTKYNPGDLVAYDGQVYRVVQEHTSQADWRPDGVPALYTPAH